MKKSLVKLSLSVFFLLLGAYVVDTYSSEAREDDSLGEPVWDDPAIESVLFGGDSTSSSSTYDKVLRGLVSGIRDRNLQNFRPEVPILPVITAGGRIAGYNSHSFWVLPSCRHCQSYGDLIQQGLASQRGVSFFEYFCEFCQNVGGYRIEFVDVRADGEPENASERRYRKRAALIVKMLQG